MIERLRFWAHKVLPLVYDNSLSYYELLCKVVDKLNEVIELVNLAPENVKDIVQQILDEWLEDGTIQQMIDNLGSDIEDDVDEKLAAFEEEYNQALDDLRDEIASVQDNGVGETANIRQLFMSFYSYPTSTGERTDITPSGTSAYYVQGFCKTPGGFAFVRLAPETNKIDENDISQIFEFSASGDYIRSVGVNVHHGNGMIYHDGFLYVDVGERIAKVRYSDLAIVGYVEMGGTCPAFNNDDGCMYSVDTSTLMMYKYDFSDNTLSTIHLSADCPAVYNGSMIKDGVFYGITYMNDLVMIDVESGKFLGGKHVLTTDVNNIKLLELEDMDCDENGNCYVLVNQVHFSTVGYDVDGNRIQIRKPGFYIGQIYLNGGGSALAGENKHIQFHPTDIVVKSDSNVTEAKNAKPEFGTATYPFRTLAAASFFDADVRQVNCDDYDVMYGADIYQPLNYANYGLINNLGISTDYPLAIKGWTGYLKGGAIKITDYGLTLAYCDIASVDIDESDATGDYIGYLYNGRAEIIPSGTGVVKMKVNQCELSGGNVIPDGACTTKLMKYTNQSGTVGNSVTLHTPILGGARGTRIALLNRTADHEQYIIYNLYGDKLYGTDGSVIDCDVTNRANGEISFTAPFDFDRVDVF